MFAKFGHKFRCTKSGYQFRAGFMMIYDEVCPWKPSIRNYTFYSLWDFQIFHFSVGSLFGFRINFLVVPSLVSKKSHKLFRWRKYSTTIFANGAIQSIQVEYNVSFLINYIAFFLLLCVMFVCCLATNCFLPLRHTMYRKLI